MINVDSNSLYRIDLTSADQPGTARLDSVSLPLGPSRKVEIRTNRPLNKSKVATVIGNIESLPPASEIVVQEEENTKLRLENAKEKVRNFQKLTTERVKQRRIAMKGEQRKELLSKAKRLNAVRVYCVQNRVGAGLEEKKSAGTPPKPSISHKETDFPSFEIKEVAEDPSREVEELVFENDEDESPEKSPDGLQIFSQHDLEPTGKRSFKSDFAGFGTADSVSGTQGLDTQTPKLDLKPLQVAKTVTFHKKSPQRESGIGKTSPAVESPAKPKGRILQEKPAQKELETRKLTRKEERELGERLMNKQSIRSRSEARLTTGLFSTDEPLPALAAIVVYNTNKALEALSAHSRRSEQDTAVIRTQTKATAKLHLTGVHSNLPRKWGQNEFDDLALQIAMVREIASIQEQHASRPRPKSAEPRAPWGTPVVPNDAHRIKRVRVSALTLERSAVAQRKKSPGSPVLAYYKPLTSVPAEPRGRSQKGKGVEERPKSAGSKESRSGSSKSPVLSPFSLTPRKGATLESIEVEFKKKFKRAMRYMRHVPYYERNERMKSLREQYETELAEAKANYLAALPPKTQGERHLELVRYSAALKALVKDKLKERYSEDIPAVCTCGALSTKRDPRKPVQCANNCPFYQRQQDYQKAVSEVMHTFNAV